MKQRRSEVIVHRVYAATDRGSGGAPNRGRSNFGEGQELEIETLLSARFLRDTIQPVPKGEFAATSSIGSSAARPTVRHNSLGIEANQKLERGLAAQTARRPTHSQGRDRGDSQSGSPKEVETFGLVDRVWVPTQSCSAGAVALRHLIETRARGKPEGNRRRRKWLNI
jgi:hypothetical protein